jgi:hypothetical protein
MARTWGNISPEPVPCTIRATTRVSPFGAAPQAAEAMVKMIIPMRNRRLRPKMSPSLPLVISTQANASE